MNKLVGISFNGVDEKTDLARLVKIQQMFPLAEFGIILSKNWMENGNRYWNPYHLSKLEGLELNLSAHLCGSVVREAIRDNWEPALKLCNGYFGIFKRTQMNIAPYDNNPEILKFDNIPDNIREVIIQQRAPEKVVLDCNTRALGPNVVILIDGSGGCGIEGSFAPVDGFGKVGYAGGLNPVNIVKHTLSVRNGGNGFAESHGFWMDIESGVRTDDWFDLDKVVSICGQVYGALGITPNM